MVAGLRRPVREGEGGEEEKKEKREDTERKKERSRVGGSVIVPFLTVETYVADCGGMRVGSVHVCLPQVPDAFPRLRVPMDEVTLDQQLVCW